jgi:acetyl-CoA carboxylase / biotin carboxylase 1
LQIAERVGVSAVWPGWGHASENPELPDALTAKGIVFLGPPATSMNALGDKVGSALIAQAAGVPTLAWSGSHVSLTLFHYYLLVSLLYLSYSNDTTFRLKFH